MRLVPFLLLAGLAVLGPVRAETLGAYEHGVMRENDGKLIVCYDESSAVEAAEAVNVELLALAPDLLNAADDTARQAIYQERLYPSAGWQVLLTAIRDLRCDLVDQASHIPRATVIAGPADLAALGAAHGVVRSDFLIGASQATTPGWVVTTETLPPAP